MIFRHTWVKYPIWTSLIILLSAAALFTEGCAYRVVRATPHLQGGVTSLYLKRVENHSDVIGIEGVVRRHLESRFLDYIHASTEDLPSCGHFGTAIQFHGMNQRLLFVNERDTQEHQVICQKKDYPTAVIVRISSVTVQPVAFVQGTATGASLGLQKDALLASTYQVSASIEIELQDPLIPHVEDADTLTLSKTSYAYTSTYAASTFDSDITGASRNYLRNQLALVENMEEIGRAIAENVYSNLTSVF